MNINPEQLYTYKSLFSVRRVQTTSCNVLQTFWKVPSITCFSGLKNSHQVGDFQVATGGGFWVATRV